MKIIPDGRGADPRRGVAKDIVAEYERDVWDVIATIRKSRCGQILLSALDEAKSSTNVVRIMPQPIDQPNPHLDPLKYHHDIIFYEPRTYEENSPYRPYWDPRNATRPDDVLFHELFHVLHWAAAANAPRDDPVRYPWDNRAEFTAILVTNIYRSELGRKILRAGHDGTFMSLHAFSYYHDREFRRTFRKEIDKSFREIPWLLLSYSIIPAHIAAWNPLTMRIPELRGLNHLEQMYAAIRRPATSEPLEIDWG